MYYLPENKVLDSGVFAPSRLLNRYEGDQFYKLNQNEDGTLINEGITEAELSAKIVGLVTTADGQLSQGVKSM